MLSEPLPVDQGFKVSPGLSERPDLLAVRRVEEKCRFNLRIREENIDAVATASGLSLPPIIGTSVLSEDMKVLCLGPDEWQVVTDMSGRIALLDSFTKLTKDIVFSHVDISHRNVGFKISGYHCERLINIGCPLDLSLSKFPVGKCTRTVFENVEIMLLRQAEDAFYLEIWRSFAPYLIAFFNRYTVEMK